MCDEMTFREMAKACGMPRKAMYTMREVSAATGVALNTLYDEAAAGRLTTFTPEGRARGKLVQPAWVDEWIERGTRRATAWQ